MARFSLPKGQLVADIFLPAGTVIDNANGAYSVTSVPNPADAGLVGRSLAAGYIPPPDASALDDDSFKVLLTHHNDQVLNAHGNRSK